MSDAEHVSRKELLKPNRMEKQLYAFVDHAYREKSLYMSVGIALLVLVVGIWGGWKYSQNERINQANLYHLALTKLNNPNLSPDERLSQGIVALQDYA